MQRRRQNVVQLGHLLELAIKLIVLYWAYPTFGLLAPLIGVIVANIAGIYWLYGRMAPKNLAHGN